MSDALLAPPPPSRGARERSPFIDIGALLAGGLPDPPVPTILRRDDGAGLFYAGQVNVLFGDPETGKTWIAYAAAVEALAEGLGVLLIDADHNGAQQVVSRLLALGAEVSTLVDPDRFRLAEPDDRETLRAAVTEAVEWTPDLAVVDSIGEVLPILGLSSNSPDDYTTAHREVLRPLALAGAAVVAIDHLSKGHDSRQAGPTGTAAKGRAVGGVSLRVTVRDPFTPGRGGSAVLSIRKDRPGGLRAVSPLATPEAPAGVFTLAETPEGLLWRIAEPTEGDAPRATSSPSPEDLAAVARLPEAERTQRGIKRALGVGSTKANTLRQAFEALTPVERSALSGVGVQERGAPRKGPPDAPGERSRSKEQRAPVLPESGVQERGAVNGTPIPCEKCGGPNPDADRWIFCRGCCPDCYRGGDAA